MNNHKSVYIRQWSWDRLDVSIWRNGHWGKEHKNPTPSSRDRLRKLTHSGNGQFKSYRADLGIHSMTLWANEYEEPRPEPIIEVEPEEEFYIPNLEPDVLAAYRDYRKTIIESDDTDMDDQAGSAKLDLEPNRAYYDYRETMDDFVESTRS